jgi:hypothetical protein
MSRWHLQCHFILGFAVYIAVRTRHGDGFSHQRRSNHCGSRFAEWWLCSMATSFFYRSNRSLFVPALSFGGVTVLVVSPCHLCDSQNTSVCQRPECGVDPVKLKLQQVLAGLFSKEQICLSCRSYAHFYWHRRRDFYPTFDPALFRFQLEAINARRPANHVFHYWRVQQQ